MTNSAKESTFCLTVFHPAPLSLKPFKTHCLLVLPKFVYSSCLAACLTFFHYPHHLVAVIGSCRALALLKKQAHVWVFPGGITILVLIFSDIEYAADIDY